jgi:hypothetical protein
MFTNAQVLGIIFIAACVCIGFYILKIKGKK